MPHPRHRHPGAPSHPADQRADPKASPRADPHASPQADPKASLRAELRAVRRARGPRPDEGPALAARVLALPEVESATTVAAYVAGPLEPATAVLIQRLLARGARVLLPVVLPDLDLDWAADDGARRPGTGPGALEPGGPRLGPGAVAGAQVVVVPALAADRSGRRLGQGGGSYDRALARVAAGTLVVALVHDDELLDEPVPVQPHDRPVHVVVTPTRTLRVGPPVSPPVDPPISRA